MFKKVLCFILAFALIGITGCSLASKATETTTTTAPASVVKVRETTLSKIWAMKQLEINLTKELTIELKLKDGDKVDGYFYVEKGDITSFSISGNSVVYASTPTDSETKRIVSDRFSFTASQAQGISYSLIFNAPTTSNTKNNETTVFMELIYPVTGAIYVPFGTK